MSGKNLETPGGYKTRDEGLINLNILLTVRDHWHWFAISALVCTTSALLFLRYTTLQYQVTASLLIRDESRGSDFGDAALLDQLGLASMNSSIDNEIEILKSRSLMESVIDELQLHVQYFASGRLKVTELYDKSPFHLLFLKPLLPEQAVTYKLIVKDLAYYMLSTSDQTFTGRFGDTVKLPQGLAILKRTKYQPARDDEYTISLSVKEEVIRRCTDALTISATNKMASVVDISITAELPLKGEAILKKLLEIYLKTSVLEKNHIADSTIGFIDRNLKKVFGELATVEKSIEDFRTNHQIVNLTDHTRLLLEAASQYSEEKNSLSTRLKILGSLQKDLLENSDFIIPSSLFQQSAGFAELAKKFNEIHLLRARTLSGVPESNPILLPLDMQLTKLRLDMIAGISAQKNELEVSIKALDRHSDSIQTQILKIPGLEKRYVDYTRQQQIKQELYLFLLKKRMETAISKSSAVPNGRIIDMPKAKSQPVNPSQQLVLLLSGLFSIAIPLGALHLKNILNDRINTRPEIQENCQVPILADISKQKGIATKRFDPNRPGLVTEQFRALRTNIQFLAGAKSSQVILITSSMGGEGKSFVAVNLCHSLALAGKKVILAELDLRKPTLSEYLGLKKIGFSELLTSEKNPLSHIQKFGINTTFDIITSGHPPPNPVEMLALPKVAETIALLREKYDYIVFDTPPIGLVTDARILSQYADLSLYVIRQEVTFKRQLADIQRISEGNQFPRLHIILNGVKQDASYQYNYGYNHQKQNWINRQYRKLKFANQ